MNFLFAFLTTFVFATAPSLGEYSAKINSGLPETYDRVTKLLKTSVENDDLVFHFVILATKDEFAATHGKVKAQVLSTICRHDREGKVLRQLRKAVIYRYENEKGQALGEFMVRPAHCEK